MTTTVEQILGIKVAAADLLYFAKIGRADGLGGAVEANKLLPKF